MLDITHQLYSARHDPVVSPCRIEPPVNSDYEDDDNYFKYTGDTDVGNHSGVPEILADLYGELIPVLYNKGDKPTSEDESIGFNLIQQEWDNSLHNLDKELINDDMEFDLLEANGIDLDCLLDDLTGIKDEPPYPYDDSMSSGQSSTFSPILGDTSESSFDTSPPHLSFDLNVLSSIEDTKFSNLKLPVSHDSTLDFNSIKQEDTNILLDDIYIDPDFKDKEDIILRPVKEEMPVGKYDPEDDEDEEIRVDDDFLPMLPNTYPLASHQLARARTLGSYDKQDRSPFGSNTAPSYVDHSGRSEKISRNRMHMSSCCDTFRSRSSGFSSSGHRSDRSCPPPSTSRRSVANHGQSEKDRRREQNRVQRFAEHQVRRIRAFQPYIDQYFKRPRPTKVGVLRASIAVMEMYAASNLDAQIASLKADISMFRKKARSKTSY